MRLGGTCAAPGGDGSGNDGQVIVDGVAPIQAVITALTQVMRTESASSADGSFAQGMRNLTEQTIDLVDDENTAVDAEKGEEKKIDDKNTAATKGEEKNIDDKNTGDDETQCEDTILEDDGDESQSLHDIFDAYMCKLA